MSITLAGVCLRRWAHECSVDGVKSKAISLLMFFVTGSLVSAQLSGPYGHSLNANLIAMLAKGKGGKEIPGGVVYGISCKGMSDSSERIAMAT